MGEGENFLMISILLVIAVMVMLCHITYQTSQKIGNVKRFVLQKQGKGVGMLLVEEREQIFYSQIV